ncbi:putative cation-transporting ATPase 13A3 [Clonorchis sinensis]|uniref:Cation-transporting ATPase n=1 Tax=Clonorchis sinensis TaxID=79923 RepID=A0A8T1MPS0_CLOSI|nr:putative cation-transporting ATPase 13A3 [Clonorchis sinensis]
MKNGHLNGEVIQDPLGTCSRIYEPDGTPCEIKGYTSSLIKKIIVYISYFLTCGLLRLVFHWMPQWMLKCTHRLCPLPDAQKVLIKDSSGVYFVLRVLTSVIEDEGEMMVKLHTVPINKVAPDCSGSMDKDPNITIYFFYKKLKYIWDRDLCQFNLLSEWDGCPYVKLFPARPLPEHIVVNRRALYEPNEIVLRITPIIKLLLTKCLNPFYCFQAFSCALWFADDYWMYASCILIMSVLSLIMQVYELRRNEIALKKTVCGSALVSACREVNGLSDFIQVDSTELVPGDLIEIPRKGCVMHCDAFVLTGNCIVNESTLTGESVPVTKTPLPDNQQLDGGCNLNAMARHVLFGGTSVIQTRNYANERVLALVARTGFRTAKGELVRSILFPKPMKFKFTQDALKFVLALACLSVIGLGLSIYLMYRSGVDTKSMFIRALDLVTIVVPPALPVAMTVGIVFAQRRLRSQDIYCINPGAINVCGVVSVTCFDKTGTLTEDGLDLWGVVPNDQGNFGEPQFKPHELERGPLIETMATCHSLTLIEGVLSGDPLDLKMFQSTQWEFSEQISEDHCKFEMAVPAIVRPPAKSSSTHLPLESTVNPEMLPYEIGIIRQFPFTSSMQRMSVVARVLNSTHFNLYVKGAPEMIEALCRRDTIPSDFHSVLLQYTREGYRVLALAWRPLKISYTRVLRIPRERAEHDLLFLGFLVMENRLKPESAPVIQTLRNANIRPIMVTGDNMLTAVSVARDCEMIDELDRIIIVSAKPPPKVGLSSTNLDDVAAGDVTVGRTVPISFPVDANFSAPSSFVAMAHDSPLVEFHYAEDLHKPVTEVTATDGGWRNGQLRPSHPEKARHRWFRRRWKSRTRTPVTVAVNVDDGAAENDHVIDASHSHRVNIRMIDRPDFHLAISGKTWAVIKEHYPWLIPKLVVKGTVFARFSPDQKTQLIEALQSVGYFVAMCGDGANDCGALKAAHAGISLSEAEASVASPFTSKQQNISCVPTLVREGRCALVTSFGTFKFMCGYSLVQFFTTILLYTIGSNITDPQFLFIDLFLITTLSVTFGYTRAYAHLSVEPPNMHLVSAVTLMSLGFQLLVNYLFQLGSYLWVRAQPWYINLYEVSEDFELKNYESTVLFIISAYQYSILAIVFSKGAPYRRSIVSNTLFIVNLVVCLAVTIYLTTYPFDELLDFFQMVRIPSAIFLLIIHSAALANFMACYLLETFVDGVSFRRRLLHIRRALFPRRVERKDYERIREEIDRLAGSWPPIIRSASVQALPRELFNEGDAVPSTNLERRKLTTSGFSSDTEDESVSPGLTCLPAPGPPVHRVEVSKTVNNANITIIDSRPRRQPITSARSRRRHSAGELRLDSQPSRTSDSTVVHFDSPDDEDVFEYPPKESRHGTQPPWLRNVRRRSRSSGPTSEGLFVTFVSPAPDSIFVEPGGSYNRV